MDRYDERSSSKLHPLDLSKRGSDLEVLFNTYINQIPDLLMPPVVRLQGEEDFFDKTKSIKLRPFRKQRIFDTCISPELVKRDGDESIETRANSSKHIEDRNKIYCKRRFHTSGKNSAPKQHSRQKEPSDFERVKTQRKKNLISSVEINRKYNLNNYSDDERDNLDRDYFAKIGYDRLFRQKFDHDYPFSNPMPESMMTDQNIDNLRDIIVSSCDIEWKMLTPVRPENDYEERFFNHLIELHRLRYKSRLEAGYFGIQRHRIPFRHSRHPYVLHHFRPRRVHATSISMGVKLRSKFKPRDERARSIGHFKLKIPKVTLTTDERSASEKLVSSEDETNCEDVEEFNYSYFSRFSRRNQQRQQQQQLIETTSPKLKKLRNRSPLSAATSSQSVTSLLSGSASIFKDKNNGNNIDNYDEQMDRVVGQLLATSL